MTRSAIVATSMGALLALGGCEDEKKQQAAAPAEAKPQQETCVTVKDRRGPESAQIVDSCTGQTWFYNTTI
jgi:nitrous oxide reductase accessory protein NosL